MITISNPSFDPFYNQALEEYLFENATDDIFYLWQNDPAVIVGSYQNICREVHVSALYKQGIPVLRRISGGGTVYHDRGNVNYTLILNCCSYPGYDSVLEPVVRALCEIGVPAHKNRASDIAIGDLKISGSAQRSAGGKLLHHGTLLFQSDLHVLDHITTHRKNECFHSNGTESSICTVTNIQNHLAQPMTINEFKERFTAHMLAGSASPARHMTLTAEQESEIRQLAEKKYKSWEWTWGRTPPFVYERNGSFLGKPIRIFYQAKHGIVSCAKLACDTLDCITAEALLNGARLDPDCFSRICHTLTKEAPDALLDLLL